MPFLLVFFLGLAAIYAIPEAKATPTQCEFIAIELFEAVDRGDLTEAQAMEILDRCDRATFPEASQCLNSDQ